MVFADKDREIDAINLACSHLSENPRNYHMLCLQAEMMRRKGRNDLALECAKRAVNANPAEAISWITLTGAYIDAEDYESALLSLNSCPMFTVHPIDTNRLPDPQRSSMPITPDIPQSVIISADIRQSEVDPGLLRLPAQQLRGTFENTYSLLTKMNAALGWDGFLQYRSSVYVMEDEFKPKRGSNGNFMQLMQHILQYKPLSMVLKRQSPPKGPNLR